MNSKLKFGLALLGALVSAQAFSSDFVVDSSGIAKGGRSGNVLVGFLGDGVATDGQMDLRFDPDKMSVEVRALGGASCTSTTGLVRVISPDLGGKVLENRVTPMCQITVKALKGALPARPFVAENAICGAAGKPMACGMDQDDSPDTAAK